MKLNKVVYDKMYLQAEEAKERDLVKLASNVFSAIGPIAEDEKIESFSDYDLNNKLEEELWKAATAVIKFYDVNSIDIQKIDEIVKFTSNQFRNDLKVSLSVEKDIGKFEEKVPGQE